MAKTYPLSLADFADRLQVVDMQLYCPAEVTEARTAGGEIIRGRRGSALWLGNFTLRETKPHCGRAMAVLLDLLSAEGASFLIGPHRYQPQADPGAAVRLEGVASNNRDVTLTGLPAGYQIGQGDYLSFTYAGRQAFHAVAFPVTASGTGRAVAEVYPPVRPGWSANAVIEMRAPRFKALLREVKHGAHNYWRLKGAMTHSAATFDFIQTLR